MMGRASNVLEGVVVLVMVASVIVAVALATIRVLRGPTTADRIIAQDVLFAAGVVACIAATLATGRTGFLDVGIGLALVGFVSATAWARLIQRTERRRGDEEEPREEEEPRP